MAVAPLRPYGPAQPPVVAATGYTVPAFGVVRIRHIHAANTTGTAAPFTVSIGTDAVGTRIYSTFSVPAYGIHDSGDTNYVLLPGEILQVSQATAGAITLTISGQYET